MARSWFVGLVVTGSLAVGLSGCSGDATGPAAPIVSTHTVDASNGLWAYVSLAAPTITVNVADPAGSPDWDLGFSATAVAVNGAGAGPGGVSAVCLCQNQGLTNEQYMALTPASGLTDFDAVTAANIPAGGWSTTTFDDKHWYRYDLAGQHQIWPTYDVYLVKRGEAVYKFQITGYYGAAGEPRQVTFRFAQLAG